MTLLHFNSRVRGRTTLATTLLLPKYSDLITNVGLRDADLAEIRENGELAENYDRKQHDDLGTQRQTIAVAAEEGRKFEEEHEHVRNRISAVIADIKPTDPSLAGWLSKVAFENMRLVVREPAVQPGTPPTDPNAPVAPPAAPAKPVKEMVERRDRYARALAAAQFSAALLEPERKVVVRAMAQRGFPEKRLQAFHALAQSLTDRLDGTESLPASDFTRLEAEAVTAQKLRWDACRRMIRQAVQGDAELERLWAAC